jgi:hypothetical protein
MVSQQVNGQWSAVGVLKIRNTMMKISVSGLIKKVFAVVAVFGFLWACKKDDSMAADCSGPAKSFSTNVLPIVQASCATNSSCHGTGSSNGPGVLTSYSEVFNARVDIRSNVASGHMPLNGSLTAAEKNAIICWIDNGAPNN